MQSVRSRARFVAAIALAWHVVVIAAVATAFSCDAGSEHAGMKDCPLHRSAPVCPLHADKHGTHDCDCPTIGCSQTDAGFMAVFGAVGILPAARRHAGSPRLRRRAFTRFFDRHSSHTRPALTSASSIAFVGFQPRRRTAVSTRLRTSTPESNVAEIQEENP